MQVAWCHLSREAREVLCRKARREVSSPEIENACARTEAAGNQPRKHATTRDHSAILRTPRKCSAVSGGQMQRDLDRWEGNECGLGLPHTLGNPRRIARGETRSFLAIFDNKEAAVDLRHTDDSVTAVTPA